MRRAFRPYQARDQHVDAARGITGCRSAGRGPTLGGAQLQAHNTFGHDLGVYGQAFSTSFPTRPAACCETACIMSSDSMQWPAIWLKRRGGARSDFGQFLKNPYSPKFLIFEELSHDTMFAGFGWMVFCLLHQDFETPMAHNSTCIPPLHVILGCGSMHFRQAFPRCHSHEQQLGAACQTERWNFREMSKCGVFC